jgi:hypothetical protein
MSVNSGDRRFGEYGIFIAVQDPCPIELTQALRASVGRVGERASLKAGTILCFIPLGNYNDGACLLLEEGILGYFCIHHDLDFKPRSELTTH